MVGESALRITKIACRNSWLLAKAGIYAQRNVICGFRLDSHWRATGIRKQKVGICAAGVRDHMYRQAKMWG